MSNKPLLFILTLGTAAATLILAGDNTFDAIICSGSDGSMLSTDKLFER